jgi:hypothetical protein
MFAARIYYRPRNANMGVRSNFGVGVTQVLGTTGWAFIRQAWSALAKIDWPRTTLGAEQPSAEGRVAYNTNVDARWYDPRPGLSRFNVRLGRDTATGQTRGTRWDADFNRALWAWTFAQWDEYNKSHGLPNTIQQFAFDRGSTEYRDSWVNLLNDIQNCETTQRISRAAMGAAATLVADSLGLISSTTTQNVWLDPQTVSLQFGIDPFAPLPEFQFVNRRFATWQIDQAPSSNVPPYGVPVSFLTAEADLPIPGATGTGTTGTGTSTAGPSPVPPTAGGGAPPVEVGPPSLTAAQELGLVAGYTVGGMVLAGGLWTIYQSMKEER